MTSSSNKRRFTRLLAATLALGTIAAEPAFALCNPGSPNCIKVWPGSRLANIKNQLANPGTLGSNEIECQNAKVCGFGIASAKLAVSRRPVAHEGPRARR